LRTTSKFGEILAAWTDLSGWGPWVTGKITLSTTASNAGWLKNYQEVFTGFRRRAK